MVSLSDKLLNMHDVRPHQLSFRVTDEEKDRLERVVRAYNYGHTPGRTTTSDVLRRALQIALTELARQAGVEN
jgi:hypothetical protein